MKQRKQVIKQFFAICRWLHIYVAMTFLTLLLFFCITGITLNHTSWFDSEDSNQIYTFALPAAVLQDLQASDTPDVTSTRAFIESKTNLSDPRSVDIDVEAGEISFDYPLPAGYAFITVFSETGEVEVEHKKGSLVMLLNDLHKGRHTGVGWSWVIDISAVAITLFSLTGLVILLQLSKKRNMGLIVGIIGLVLPVAAYFLWVPFLATL